MIAYRPSHTQISDRANKPYNSKSVVHDKTRPHVWGNVIHCGNRGVTVLCEGREVYIESRNIVSGKSNAKINRH